MITNEKIFNFLVDFNTWTASFGYQLHGFWQSKFCEIVVYDFCCSIINVDFSF